MRVNFEEKYQAPKVVADWATGSRHIRRRRAKTIH